MPTVREIAERAGVSISTVSLALNDKQGVSAATRQRVLQAAAALRRDERDVAKHNGDAKLPHRPLLILVLHPAKVDDDVFTQSLRGMWDAVDDTNVQLQLVINEPEVVATNVSQLFFSNPDLYPDGLMVLGARKEEPLVEQALALGIPCVLVQRECPDPAISSVGVDEAEIAYEATTHLIELGHRAIAFVGGRTSYSFTDGRLRGYRSALEDHDLSVLDRRISLGWDRSATARVLKESPEITAIVFIDDGFALDYGLPVLEEQGHRVPWDISVVSFDDIREVRAYDPPITSAEYPFYQASSRALRILEEQIRDPMLRSQHIRFHAKLNKRASSGPPRRTAR